MSMVTCISRMVVLSIVVTACTTSRPKQPITLPMPVQRIFKPCYPTEGSLSAKVVREGKLVGFAEVDWRAENGEWRAELSDPIGQPLLSLQFQSAGKITAEGVWSDSLPKLTVDDEYLVVDGHKLAIKASHLPCYFNGTMPSADVADMVSFTRDNSGYNWEGYDTFRTFSGSVKHNLKPAVSGYEACTDYRWSRAFGLIKRNIVICINKFETLSGRFIFPDNYQLEWAGLDD